MPCLFVETQMGDLVEVVFFLRAVNLTWWSKLLFGWFK